MINVGTCTEKMEDEAVRLFDGGKLRRAERVLKQMLASDPNCLPAHFQLARVYIRTGEYECALSHARRTLKLNPKEPRLRVATHKGLRRRCPLAFESHSIGKQGKNPCC
jgi:Tfp pilus assembly protein PilF